MVIKTDKKELKNLFNGMKNDDRDAYFNELYKKYAKLVKGIAFSISKNTTDSDDIVQSVFYKIYSLDKEKLPTNNEASWLYAVSKNETINFLKKKNNNIDIENIYDITDDNNEIEKIIDRQTFQKLIEGLNDKEKEIMSLKILGNLSFKEISNIIDEPQNTVKWRYYKSIDSLKICLSNLAMAIVAFVIGIREFINNDGISDKKEISQGIQEDVSEAKKEYKENSMSELKIDAIETIGIAQNATNTNGIIWCSISGVFLVATIIFAIFFKKHQLKRKKK